jgi:2-methylisocitrate lyase-like PEP mutase family enzyme
MTTTDDKRAAFLALHVPGTPLILPNPWDAGTARLFAFLGFEAVATTSGGFAVTLGRSDYAVSRDEAVAHATGIASAVDLPVSADLENGFADEPGRVAATVRRAVEVGLAGCSVEDFTTRSNDPIYGLELAAERVAAAAEAAHAPSGPGLVLTARAENYLRGRRDLADTIRRLQAYQEAGADVLYAPAMSDPDDIRRLVESVDRPINVLVTGGLPTVGALAEIGVARISVGSAFNSVAMAAVARAATELRDHGAYGWLEQAADGRRLTSAALA